MKANYHTHTTWCDGKNTPREVVEAAIARGFDAIGFSSHSMLPQDDVDWVLTPAKTPRYAAEIRALAKEYATRIRVLCGVEADYIPGGAEPSRRAYAAVSPDYIIGSVHFVRAPDGGIVCVDKTPESLADGIRDHFGGSVEAYVTLFRRGRRVVSRGARAHGRRGRRLGKARRGQHRRDLARMARRRISVAGVPRASARARRQVCA